VAACISLKKPAPLGIYRANSEETQAMSKLGPTRSIMASTEHKLGGDDWPHLQFKKDCCNDKNRRHIVARRVHVRALLC
jgi:hypothetical protein